MRSGRDRGVAFLLLFLLAPLAAWGHLVEGRVVDTRGVGVGNAEIRLQRDGRAVAITDGEGAFRVVVENADSVSLYVSALGYIPRRQVVGLGRGGVAISVVLEEATFAIEGVGVAGRALPYAAMQRIDVAHLLQLHGAGSSVESFVKLLPGVHSANELSSQYSVRGGSYDENLVYIDGIEVFRPQLARSGSQEGMSVINPDMVEAVEFSSGAFPASYGDKLSSVLNVKYRRPRHFAAHVDLSLMENRACLEGATPDRRLSGIVGARYKTTRLLLNTTETKGDYFPSYLDAQAKGNWSIGRGVELSALFGFSRNVYSFRPEKKITRFGALTSEFLQMNVYYEGQERDIYATLFGTLEASWRATPNFKLQGQIGGNWMREEENFDILGEYWLAELRGVEESRPALDSASNVGIGGFLEHARNRLEGMVVAAKMRGTYTFRLGSVEGGLELTPRYFRHATREWTLIDSAGYALPRTATGVPVHGLARGEGLIASMLYSAYVQTTLRVSFGAGKLTIVAGVRGSGMDRWQNMRVSPRFLAEFVPAGAGQLRVYLGGGVYYQYPFYREMRDRRGIVHDALAPQRSVHALGGLQWSFLIAERPVKLQAEGYCKWGSDLIPYTLDNVRVRYEAQNAAVSRTFGLDVKINGDLAPGVESWLSLSVMRSVMRITDNLRDATRQPLDNSFFLGPQDQLFGGSLFLQDYFPGLPGFRVSMQASYALGVPFSMPSGRYGLQARMPAYRRVDIGFSYAFKDENYSLRRLRGARWLKRLVVSAEVLNLLNFYNTVSYMWIRVPNSKGSSSLVAVPNYLTGRCVNLRCVVAF